jgi:hypothetical protein
LDETQVYNSIRAEIVSNHMLMHWYSIIVALALLAGVVIVENRKTVLSVFLPLLSLAWAAAIVRFDFFIHRQALYLRAVESRMTEHGIAIPLWESWKVSVTSTQFVVPVADLIAVTVIVTPTIYLLFGPAQRFFELRHWRGGRLYAWVVASLILLLLCSLAVIPRVAALGHGS